MGIVFATQWIVGICIRTNHYIYLEKQHIDYKDTMDGQHSDIGVWVRVSAMGRYHCRNILF